MRVVIDGRYLGSRASGIGNYVRALVERLPILAPDLEFRVWLGPEGSDGQASNRVRWHRVVSKANGLLTLLGPRLLDRLTPGDLFHGPANVLGFGFPCPTIVTVHDTMWIERPNDCQPISCLRPVSSRYFRVAIRRALRQACRIVTVSHSSARAIERVDKAAAKKIRVIYNGCNSQFTPPTDRAKVRAKAAAILGFEDDYLLVVGQNQPSKGHEIALKAYAAANPQGLRLVFVERLCTGHGLAEWIRAQKLGDRVRIVAHLEFDAFLAVMQSARALLQPSYDEGFGLPAVEAAACGCHIVASDIEVFREVLGDVALYAEPGNINAWREAIDQVAAKEDIDGSGRQQLQDRARWFDWDRAARATLEVYREVIAEMTHR